MPTEIRKQKDQDRKDRTRSALLEAAERVLVKQGYHRTLVSDIVAEAGVGQGTFYRHFSTKRDAFLALFDQFSTSLTDQFASMSTNMPTTEAEYMQASVDAIRRVATVIERNRGAMLLFLREGPSIDREFAGLIETLCERLADIAKLHLDHAIARGFSRPCDSALVSQSLLGIALRLLDRWLEGRLADRPLDETIQEVVTFAFTGFGAGNPRGERAP